MVVIKRIDKIFKVSDMQFISNSSLSLGVWVKTSNLYGNIAWCCLLDSKTIEKDTI